MARRSNAFSSLLDGFAQGYDLFGKIAKDKELADVAREQPTQTLGNLNEGSPEAVQAQLDSGAGMGEARTLSATGRAPTTYSFMGQTQDKPFTQDQISTQRRLAQANVLEKNGDVEGGSRLRNLVQQGLLTDLQISGTKASQEREAARFGWEKDAQDREANYRSQLDGIYRASPFFTKGETYSQQLAKYDADMQSFNAARDRGDATAVAPVKPTAPVITPGEMVANASKLLALNAEYGKASPQDLMAQADKLKSLQKSNYVQGIRALHDGAPLTQVVQLLQDGGFDIDPNAVIEDRTIPPKKPGDVGTRIVSVKRKDGTTMTLDTRAELDSLGEAGDYFERAYKAHSMATQDRQAGAQLDLAKKRDTREQAEFDAGAPSRALKTTADTLRLGLANTDDPAEKQRIQGKLDAMNQGLTGKDGTAEEKLASALVRFGVVPNMKEALQMALSKKGASPDEIHRELVVTLTKNERNAERAVQKADQTMRAMGYEKGNGGSWALSSGAQGGAPAPKAAGAAVGAPKLQNVTAADITATAKKYGVSEDEVKRRLGLQ